MPIFGSIGFARLFSLRFGGLNYELLFLYGFFFGLFRLFGLFGLLHLIHKCSFLRLVYIRYKIDVFLDFSVVHSKYHIFFYVVSDLFELLKICFEETFFLQTELLI